MLYRRNLLYAVVIVTLLLHLFAMPMLAAPSPEPLLQSSPTSGAAVVLVNSASAGYADFAHFIKPYLDNFGVSYTSLDLATTNVGANIQNYALIIVGHRQLDVSDVYLDATEEANIVAAVTAGTGLVNFDNALSVGGSTPRYQFVQNIFGFGYVTPPTGSGVTFAAVNHYVTERHQVGESITTGSMTLAGITLPAAVTALATTGSQPFLAVTTSGAGRAVQWGAYEWMSHEVKGPLFGLDDLVWRSLVWAARKPFVMQGMPPFVTMRMDDVSGPLWWIHGANDYGFIPWAGIFTNDIDNTEAADLSNLVNSGKATAAMHAFGTSDFFYFDHNRGTNFSDATMSNHYATATAWFNDRNIPISKYVVPHYYEIGSNAFGGLQNWGAPFVGTMMDPGQLESAAGWMMKGPYRLYESGNAGDMSQNPYYADFMTIPGHPEYNNQFFNCVSEVRDITGYEWLGNGRTGVSAATQDGIRWIRRALDSMVLATLFSHEYTFIYGMSETDWRTIMQGITANIASYNPMYVSLDYACQYVRATYTSNITGSTYDPTSRVITTSLTGQTDMPTKFYVFGDQTGQIEQWLVDVPTFTGSTQVAFTLPAPLDHIVVTPALASVEVGKSQQFAAQGFDANNNPIPNLSFTWSVVNGGGSINNAGLFTAGSAPGVYANTVGASVGSIRGYASVTVTADATPPVVSATSPVNGASGVNIYNSVTVNFNEPMSSATVNTSTVQLRDPSNTVVPATVTYNATDRTATLDPTLALAYSTAYTAIVKGGSSGVKDLAGNPLAADYAWSFTTSAAPPPPPDEGLGGPILVIAAASNPFGRYTAEILRTEGMNTFTVTDISRVNATMLALYDVAILGETSLTTDQVNLFTNWVNAGGNLIAMRPDKKLAGLLGLTDAASTLSNAYLLVNTSSAPGAGIVGQTIQFHGSADKYTLNGAISVATLYSNASTATAHPAVTLRSVGTQGGQAAAFTYDLARSVVYTRQGNPAWAGQERDGYSPVRSDDFFFGASSTDPQPDWVDLNKVAIPQADEQQRLLANLILHMNSDKKPLPRFWYWPSGHKAVVIMTADDHSGGSGSAQRFEQFKVASPSGCSVADWQCIRGSAYIYVGPGMTDAQAAAYTAQGFEVALHVDTGCADYTPSSLEANYSGQLADFAATYSSVPSPLTERTHCIAWSDWVTQAQVQFSHGIRLDTNYYYWPPDWVGNRPGLFTGSGMPMRFADVDGTMIDVYQAVTQMTDESAQSYPYTIDTLLDRALGPEGYYGAFTANMHSDTGYSPGSDEIVASAKERGVPVVSARQMLQWLDGRNTSTFRDLGWNGSTLSFTITVGAGANNLQAMLPLAPASGTLTSLRRNGSSISYTGQTIKGVSYAFFAASAGVYQAVYSVDTTSPVISGVSAAPHSDGTALVTWSTDEASISRVDYGTSSASLNLSTTIASLVTSHTVMLSGLSRGVTYYYRVTSADAVGNASTYPAAGEPLSFTAPALTCPCTIWGNAATPVLPAVSDGVPIEVGVKFRTDVDGYIVGLRFYKGAANTGTHVGHLWSAGGVQLAEATFVGETASGWQEVTLATPVPVMSNTTYIASYYSSSGYFAMDADYFANSGVGNPPLHALASGVDGPNGVYWYSSSGFPTSGGSYNYWVDVTFNPSVVDVTPPIISEVTATPGTGGVATIRWTTNEASNSRVDYGISPASLNMNATGAPLVTWHAVTLTGLTLNTTYYYRVTSVDVSGNAATYPAGGAPLSFTMVDVTPSSTPTATPTGMPTATPTSTPTATPTGMPTTTPTPTATPGTGSGFPSTGVLDDFNRGAGAIGGNWSGSTSGYSIVANQLDVGSSDAQIFWNASPFGADQEVFVTMTNVDQAGAEQDLLLKSQSSTTSYSGVLEVWYDAAGKRAQVWTYSSSQSWVQRGVDIPVTFSNGDQFGARARANGTVEVYRNGILLATRDVTGWPLYASGGYIGVWFINAGNAVLDDFGGGTVGTGATATPTNTPLPPTATNTPTPTNTPLPPTATNTPTPTNTLPPPTATSTPTPTNTPLPPTATSTPTPTNTPLPPTATNTPTPTNPPLPPTATSTPTPTNTPLPPTATNTPTPTNTPLPPTATNTPTPTNTPLPPTATNTPTPTNTPTNTPTPTVVPDLIFQDGFESGNLTAWTSSTTNGGALSVSSSSALVDAYGLRAAINNNTAMYVTDDTPNAEPHYRARFYFDPTSISMRSGNAHYIFYGYSGTSTVVLRIEFRYYLSSYQLRAGLVNDGTTWKTSSWFTISDAPHYVEIDWKAATAAGANNGYLALWIDGTQRANLTGVDNDTRRIDRARLGPVAGIDSGTRGTYSLDAFESRRSTYIGP